LCGEENSVTLMKVIVRPFASLREAIENKEIELNLPKETTVGELLDLLSDKHDALRSYSGSIIVAVNREYASFDRKLEEGDEVALFPPVGGG